MKKGPRPAEYVCCAVKQGFSISKSIESDSLDSAKKQFESEFGVIAAAIHGPFFRKRAGTLDNQTSIEYLGKSFKGVYRDWHVIAFPLAKPENYVLLLFDRRIDNKKITKPVGTIIVSKEEIKTI